MNGPLTRCPSCTAALGQPTVRFGTVWGWRCPLCRSWWRQIVPLAALAA